MQLWRLLGEAGWKATLQSTLLAGPVPIGIVVESDPNDPFATNIAESLTLSLRNLGGLLATHESMKHRGKFDEPIRISIGARPF